jgi:Uma2 family endonuclease
VLEPDLLYVSRQRRERLIREGIRGAPDLVIEVLSESTARRDRIDKRRVYADFGVTEYWLADPENRSITVLVLERLSYRELLSATGDGIVLSRVLDGLSFPVSEVFAGMGELGA